MTNASATPPHPPPPIPHPSPTKGDALFAHETSTLALSTNAILVHKRRVGTQQVMKKSATYGVRLC